MVSWVWLVMGIFGGLVFGLCIGLAVGDQYWSRKFQRLSSSVDDIMKIYEIEKKEEKEFKQNEQAKWY